MGGNPAHTFRGEVGLILSLTAQVGLQQAEMLVQGIQVSRHVEIGGPGSSKGKPTTKRELADHRPKRKL